MKNRPALTTALDETVFRSYYWLKEELTAFCRSQGLPASGSKIEITERIAQYLRTGEIPSMKQKKHAKAAIADLTLETRIEPNIVCSEVHRSFFKEQIGPSFSFIVPFQKWLKSNAGKTYQDAINAYHQIMKDKKKGTSVIDRQFEYK